MHGRVGAVLLLLASAALFPCTTATARHLLEVNATPTCTALTTTSLQLNGGNIGSVVVTSSDGCCDACAKTAGCQLWSLKDSSCEMFGLGKVSHWHRGVGFQKYPACMHAIVLPMHTLAAFIDWIRSHRA
jgi:hypothetical protein